MTAMARNPKEIVSDWFDSFARGDLAAARRLVAADAVFRIFGEETTEIHGFDEFLAWYSRRRASLGESFDYRIDELLGGTQHAAALLTLSRTADGRRFEWRQVAVYRIDNGLIAEVSAYEEPAVNC